MSWGQDVAAILTPLAPLLAAGTPLVVMLRRQRRTIEEQGESLHQKDRLLEVDEALKDKVAEALEILQGNGEGRIDQMMERVLGGIGGLQDQISDMRARQERMDARDNLTDQRLGRLEERVQGISKHQRQDRESLDNIQDTVVAVKKASARQLQRIAKLEREQRLNIRTMAVTELARVVPVRDDLPPTDVDEEVDDVDVDEEIDDIPTADEGLPPAGAGGG